jgi:hypothetical protein
MPDRTEQLEAVCENTKCDNVIIVEQNWTADGANDYGGFIVECSACHEIFEIYVGRDIKDSRIILGAKKLADYNRDVEGDRVAVRKRFGLPPSNSDTQT